MSIINFVGNLLTPNYQSVYLVHSPELEEARSRGGEFDGTVGKILQEEKGQETKESQVAQFHFSDDGKVAVSTHDSIDSIHPTDDSGVAGEQRYDIISSPSASCRALNIPACTPFQTSAEMSGHVKITGYVGFIFVAIPYVVIAILTHFKKRQSTRAQRVWTMTWLVFDTIFGYFAGLPDELDPGLRFGWLVILAILSAPAIGGLVVVGQQMKLYGSCVDVNSGF